LSRKLATQALESANKEAQKVCDEPAPQDAWRWNFGLYVYLEPDVRAEGSAIEDTESGAKI